MPSLKDLSDRYRVWLCDVWGVIHNGVENFPAALDALRRHRRNSGIVLLLTNAPRPSADVAKHLASLRVFDDCYDAVVTSGDVTRSLVARYQGRGLFRLGPDRDLGLLTGLDVHLTGLDEASAILCTGLFDDTRETPDDYQDLLATALSRDLIMICANPDKVVRRGRHLVYCAGAIAERYEAVGGEVIMAGKPFAPIYELALATAARLLGQAVVKSQLLAIGDGPETDIRGAADFGIDALLIAGGISLDHAPGTLEEIVREKAPHAKIIGMLPHLTWD